MKTAFQTKFIQHLSNRKGKDEGFTLIELLVVIIIIGILAAIALPSFLNQAAKARQSEAKNAVGAVMRQQQAHRMENGKFAGNMSRLKVGLPTETDNYEYSFDPAQDGDDPSGDIEGNTTRINAEPQQAGLLGYAGGVIVTTTGQTAAQACQSADDDLGPGATVTVNFNEGADVNDAVTCDEGREMK